MVPAKPHHLNLERGTLRGGKLEEEDQVELLCLELQGLKLLCLEIIGLELLDIELLGLESKALSYKA